MHNSRQPTILKELTLVKPREEFNLFNRKNKYNEVDVEFQDLPEENMVLASWPNDLGNTQQEFDVNVSYISFLL